MNLVARRIYVNDRLEIWKQHPNDKQEQFEIEQQRNIPVRVQAILEDKINQMLGNPEEVDLGSINPTLASMLMAQLKNEYRVCTGSDVKKDT